MFELGAHENKRYETAVTVVGAGRDESNGIILDDPPLGTSWIFDSPIIPSWQGLCHVRLPRRVSGEQFRIHRKVDSDGIAEYELEASTWPLDGFFIFFGPIFAVSEPVC